MLSVEKLTISLEINRRTNSRYRDERAMSFQKICSPVWLWTLGLKECQDTVCGILGRVGRSTKKAEGEGGAALYDPPGLVT